MTKASKTPLSNLSYDELYLEHKNNKSSVIRYLNSQGYTRGDIARFMNIRYQHVKNVLDAELRKGK